MKKILYKAVVAGMLAVSTLQLNAVPAWKGLHSEILPDGSVLKYRQAGDENFHYYVSEDGYPLVRDNGILYYGKISADGRLEKSIYKATAVGKRDAATVAFLEQIDPAAMMREVKMRKNVSSRKVRRNSAVAKAVSQGPGLFPGTVFPSMGDQKAIVVLVQYKDVKFKLGDPKDYFTRMLNERGFSDYGGTGSAVDYFEECSGRQFRPQFDVYGPVTLKNNMSYYGGNDAVYDEDEHPEEMAIEACQQLDATVDFSQYDRDGDGYIDNVFIFYAGRGEADGGGDNTVWPHAWNVTSATNTPYVFDGVRLDSYGCTNEWTRDNRPDGVGTFIHEFSHVMGLPDLYSTDYSDAFTPGEWSALDYGPYNNDGCTPPLYGAFERYALGWMSPRVLDAATDVTLNPIGENEACMIPTSDSNEFFLLENRQQTGWDTYIPGHGMLVWHVLYDSGVWNKNEVNNDENKQYVDIEEADGKQTESTRAGDAFPGTSGKTSFTDTTKPSMKTWKGKSLNMPLTEIAENDGVITFKVKGGTGGGSSNTDVIYECDFQDNDGGFTFENVTLPSGLSYVWTRGNTKNTEDWYLKASAYKNQVYAAKSWAVTPVIDLTAAKQPVLSFTHAINQFKLNNKLIEVSEALTYLSVAVREEGDSRWTVLTVPSWPESMAWNFVPSDEISLAAFVGKKIQVGFCYTSSSSVAGTWEVDDVLVVDNAPSAIGDITVDKGGDGNTVEEYYNLQGIRVDPATAVPGIYVRRQGVKVSKIVIR